MTPPERAFIVAVLDQAAKDAVELRQAPREVGVFTDAMLVEDRAGAIAPMIAGWPEEDGFVEIVLLNDDRKVVCNLLEKSPPAPDGVQPTGRCRASAVVSWVRCQARSSRRR